MKEYKLRRGVCEALANPQGFFTKDINQHLSEGWELYGDPIIHTFVDGGITYMCYAQALVRDI